MTGDLPSWVIDLVCDLLDEEDVHPTLYAQAPGDQYVKWDWCPSVALNRVPDDLLGACRIVARYRKQTEVGSADG